MAGGIAQVCWLCQLHPRKAALAGRTQTSCTRSYWRGTKNPVSRFMEGSRPEVGSMIWRSLRIAVIDKNRPTSCIVTCLDVAPAVADHETGCHIDIVLAGGFEKHAGQGLAAVTLVLISVVADENVVEWKARGQGLMHGFDRRLGLRATPYIGLVRYYYQFVAVLFQLMQSLKNTGKYFQLLQCCRGERFALAHDDPINHAVTVKEHGAAFAAGGHRLPFRRLQLYRRVRNQKMPNHCLKSFCMWSDVRGIHRRNQYASVGNRRGVAAVASDDADNFGADRLCIL